MPKYLFQANYTAQGLQGLLKEGGTSRRRVELPVAGSLRRWQESKAVLLSRSTMHSEEPTCI